MNIFFIILFSTILTNNTDCSTNNGTHSSEYFHDVTKIIFAIYYYRTTNWLCMSTIYTTQHSDTIITGVLRRTLALGFDVNIEYNKDVRWISKSNITTLVL